MAMTEVRRFEQISARAYEHPADRAATSALHASHVSVAQRLLYVRALR